jgi:hypothetical protein
MTECAALQDDKWNTFMHTFLCSCESKSSRGQLLPTIRHRQGFVYVNLMKSKSEKVQGEQFAEIESEAIICDMAGEQTSHALKRLCQEINAEFYEGTPWGQQKPNYIGLTAE